MDCETLSNRIDDYVDGGLPAAEAASVESHLAGCGSCTRDADLARRLRGALRNYGSRDIPEPDDRYFSLAVARAAADGSRRLRHRYWLKGFGTAIAAGLAIFAVTLMLLAPDESRLDPTVPTVSIALEQPHTVNLVFASAESLTDASLTVLLPEGIEMSGFAGQREITWTTSLVAGRNVLPLTLVAYRPGGGELVATLRHNDDGRTFRLRVAIAQTRARGRA